jgi:predicted Zn-dependent protease
MDNNLIYLLGVIIIVILAILLILKKSNSNENQNINPIAEAKVYIAYGREKEAIKILEEYLLEDPKNLEAITMLNDIKN